MNQNDEAYELGVGKLGIPVIDWVKIPRGHFVYQMGELRWEPTFYISRYPITWIQYQFFASSEDGYKERDWWNYSSSAWNWRRKRPEPTRSFWSYAEHPIETVSWYGAMAFCQWLQMKYVKYPNRLPEGISVNCKWKICLPTEAQWEKASRGTDGRQYPWGNTYISGYANINETKTSVGKLFLACTTKVNKYYQGISPYGVFDLSGNVWEWCINEDFSFDNSDIDLISRWALKGGCFTYDHKHATSTSRIYDPPDYEHYNVGFRVCLRLDS